MDPAQVVRIYATVQEPDHECPWQTRPSASYSGSGVVLGPDRVLTGAHVVANATFLQVQTAFDPDKIVATVEAVCHDADLALLRVAEPARLSAIRPAELGELPARRDRVSVVGFPVGGEEVSVTEGVVSRIEVQTYSHSQRDLLAVTVDAAINSGNSGGPVYRGDRVVGIAFQGLDDAENVGEAVPAPLIRRFLDGVAAGRPLAVPGFGMRTQNLENPGLRRHLGVPEGGRGLLVTHVDWGASAWGVLEPGDVLHAIDGRNVANNGTVEHDGRFRTRIEVLLGEHFVGDEITVGLRRGGERREEGLVLRPSEPLVPRHRYGVRPTYFVFGGLVFQVLTLDFLQTWDDWSETAPKELLALYYGGRRTEARREVVLLSQVLADDLTVGYGPLALEVVEAVNGATPRDMADLVARVEAARGTLVIELANGGRAILDVDAARAARGRILSRYQIPSDRSTDLTAARTA